MKIWFPTIQTGSGSDIYVKILSDGLNRKGIETVVTWYPHYYEFAPYLLSWAIPPQNTDIIHVNSWSAYAFKKTNIKLVTTVHHCVHDSLYSPYRSWLQALYHNTLVKSHETDSFRKADVVCAVSEYTAKSVNEIFPYVEPIVISNGIDIKYFDKKSDLEINSDKPFRLLFAGNPQRRKGYDLLVPIMEKLGKGFELYITGGLRDIETYREKNIFFLGKLDTEELRLEYRRCDALLFPSRYEGFGYVVCEAMACGKPAITSDNSAITELVKHKKTGLLCKTDDIEEFCNAVIYLSENPKITSQIGVAAREHVLNKFTQESMIDKYIKLYKATLKNKSSSW